MNNKKTYRGITWENDRELSRKLGKWNNFVLYHKNRGHKTYEQIIDMVLDNKDKPKRNIIRTYNGITWRSDRDLSLKLGKSESYVNYYKTLGKTYEEIIDIALDNSKIKTYRDVTWKSDRDLSFALNKSASYVSYYKSIGMNYEEIIDMVLDCKTREVNKKEIYEMKKRVVARFEKVSFDEFKKAWLKNIPLDTNVEEIYNNIKLPQRSTKRSSGYDFFYPGSADVVLKKGYSTTIPTGIRCVFLKDGYDLSIYPRSSMGFKYRLHFDNTTPIIDNDYFEANNGGHIMIKLSCDPRDCESVTIHSGDKFAQGIIREFFLAEGDDEIEKNDRDGGMGSTGA